MRPVDAADDLTGSGDAALRARPGASAVKDAHAASAANAVTQAVQGIRRRERLSGFLKQKRLPDVAGTVGTQIAIFALQAVHGVILARLLGPAGRGEYGTAVFFSQTLVYAGTLGTLFSIARRAGQDATLRGPLANASVRVGLSTGLASLAVVGLLALVALPEEKAYLAPLCLAAACLLPFEQARLTLLAVDHGSGEFRRYNLNRLVAAVTFPLLLGVIWALGVVSVGAVVGLVVLTPIISLGCLLRAHKEVGPTRTAAPPVPVLVKEGLPYAFAYFAAQVLGRLDTYLALWLLSFTVQGYYAVAMAAAGLLLVVPNALALFTFNAGAKSAGELPARTLVAAGAAVLLVQALSALALAIILGPLLMLLFGDEFVEAAPLALALLPGLAIDGVATVAEGYLRGRGRPLSTLRPRILGAGVLLLLVFLLRPTWGALSIPLAASAAHAVSGTAILWVVFQRQATARDEAGSPR